jgi:predicted secreted hydrolase
MHRVQLPGDELPHKGMAIEWWYFNGFLKGKSRYSFMTCLFKADRDKVNLRFLKVPVKTVYFSHTLLFNLDTKKVQKEVLPFVMVSDNSHISGNLDIDYFYPLRRDYANYEIRRFGRDIRLKTRLFDLMLSQKKKPLLEGGSGYLDLGKKSTYYYSYSNMQAEGFIGKEKVLGIAWHDKQWSMQGYMDDPWIWFSLQLARDTEIVCFNYKGKKLATISYPDNRQETLPAEFTPVGTPWKSKSTGLSYNLSWHIRIGEFDIVTGPLIHDCEMNFGFINYWEGPLDVRVNRKKARGFMEYVAEGSSDLKGIFKSGRKQLMEQLNSLRRASIK